MQACKVWAIPHQSYAIIIKLIVLLCIDAKISSAHDLVGKKIGMHIDSYELTACLLSHATDKMDQISIRVDERATKVDALVAKEIDAIQIYSCYEAVELETMLGAPVNVMPLASLTRPGADPFPLGYGQVRGTPSSPSSSLLAAPDEDF